MEDILENSYLPQKKPMGFKIAAALIILKLTALCAIVIMFYLGNSIDANGQSFIAGFNRAITNAYNLDSSDHQTNFAILIGSLTIPIALTIISLLLLFKRKYTPLLTLVIIELVFGLTNGGSLPISTLVVLLILTINKATKEYLQRKSDSKPDNKST